MRIAHWLVVSSFGLCSDLVIIEMSRRNVLLAMLLEDEEDDEDVLLLSTLGERSDSSGLLKRRKIEGTFEVLIKNHLIDNGVKFKEYFRLSQAHFQEVLDLISPDITKQKTNFVQQPISAYEKLALTLRYLATGESFRSLAFAYRISHNHISLIIKEVLAAICKKLVPIYLPSPTVQSMRAVAEDYNEIWNFPNCCGAIDGKHCRIICPDNTGSLYFNYKSFFSIVLLALVDAKYKFICIDVGSYGKEGDSGIFKKSKMYQCLSGEEYCIPPETSLPKSNIVLPHVIVGDEAFPLSKHLLRPYPKDQTSDKHKRIFNYRLCRARRTVENAFGIMAQTFRIFFTPIAITADTAEMLITACCCLHNLLRSSNYSQTIDQDQHNAMLPTDNMLSLTKAGGNATLQAFQTREEFKEYFCSRQGSVHWQESLINRTDN